jgi:hypothetical protein
VNVEITPEPSAEERRAILDALAESNGRPGPYESRWRASGLAELRDGALAEESGSDAGVVEA